MSSITPGRVEAKGPATGAGPATGLPPSTNSLSDLSAPPPRAETPVAVTAADAADVEWRSCGCCGRWEVGTLVSAVEEGGVLPSLLCRSAPPLWFLCWLCASLCAVCAMRLWMLRMARWTSVAYLRPAVWPLSHALSDASAAELALHRPSNRTSSSA